MLTTIKELYGWHRSHGKTARRALEDAREDIASNAKRYSRGVLGWNPPAKDGSRWIESLEGSGLRLAGFADEIARIDHKGWYSRHDDFSEVFRGCVLQLPGKDGAARYLAAYEDPNNPGTYRVDVAGGVVMGEAGADNSRGDYQDDSGARDAARAADSFAEHDAEESRNYDEAWQNGSRYADMKAEEKDARQTALALLAEMREARKSGAAAGPNICATLRSKVTRLVESISESRAKREEMREANGWWIREYGAAFNDGAGETVFEGA